jgi:hypothetical protein
MILKSLRQNGKRKSSFLRGMLLAAGSLAAAASSGGVAAGQNGYPPDPYPRVIAGGFRFPDSFDVPRSVTDVRERRVDELDRPQYNERWTHRGWHLRGENLEVVANSSYEDAVFAQAQATRAWADAGSLADHWTKVHRNPNFALGKVQLFVDNAPPRDQEQPITTLDVVGMQTQVHLNVAPGQPPLEEQLPRLRQATAWALLHTAEMDRQLPPWVCTGLATYVARAGLPPDAPDPNANPAGVPLGGQQWRYVRGQTDVLDVTAPNLEQIERESAMVKFLIEGNDAAHALDFFNAVGDSIATVNANRFLEKGNFPPRGVAQPNKLTGPVDQLAESAVPDFEAWLKDPQMGQPVFQPAPTEKPEQVELESQMLFVLKLLRRFPEGAAAVRHTGARVATFDAKLGKAIVVQPKRAGRPQTIASLYSRLTGPQTEAWATLDPQGKLLLSSDTDRLSEWLGIDERQFELDYRDDRPVVVSRLNRSTALQAWLEENPDNPQRPLAKFARVDLLKRAEQPAAVRR